MTPSVRPVRTFLLLACVALAAAACAGSASVAEPDVSRGGSAAAPSAAPPAGAPAPPDGDVLADGTGGGGPTALDPVNGPAVVRTGQLQLEVADLDAALIRARAAILGLGGYVSGSERRNGDGEQLAAITYRIPAERWDEALDALRVLASKLVAEDTQAVEVTGQLVDLDARIANLRATERALQAIMAKATRISDVLEVQNQLTTVQGQIEQLTAQRARLADQAAYATLTVTWNVPLVAVAHATEGWDLGAELDRALAQLVNVGRAFVVAGLWFLVVVVPVVAVVALAIGLVLLAVRRLGLVRRSAT